MSDTLTPQEINELLAGTIPEEMEMVNAVCGELYPGEFEAMEHNGRMDAIETGMSDLISRHPTNGDMIKALFPNNPYTQLIHDMALYADESRKEIIAKFPVSWWDAPYKEEQE